MDSVLLLCTESLLSDRSLSQRAHCMTLRGSYPYLYVTQAWPNHQHTQTGRVKHIVFMPKLSYMLHARRMQLWRFKLLTEKAEQ